MLLNSWIADIPPDTIAAAEGSSSSSNWGVVIAIVAVVAAALVGVGVYLRRRKAAPSGS